MVGMIGMDSICCFVSEQAVDGQDGDDASADRLAHIVEAESSEEAARCIEDGLDHENEVETARTGRERECGQEDGVGNG